MSQIGIKKSSYWFWLPSFYKYKVITGVRSWDIHWLNLILSYNHLNNKE